MHLLIRSLARRHARLPRSIPSICAPRICNMNSTATSYPTSQPDEASETNSISAPSTHTTDSNPQSATKAPLALPEAPSQDRITQLNMSDGGTSIKLDHLGPMVVNADGTLSRIANWDRMADIEKENTLRIIGKRNQMRLAALRAKEGGDGKEDTKS